MHTNVEAKFVADVLLVTSFILFKACMPGTFYRNFFPLVNEVEMLKAENLLVPMIVHNS